MTNWPSRFISLAKEVACWSKDPDCKVGVVIVAPDLRLFTAGYNGFPAGIEDKESRLKDNAVKNYFTIHAEVNAIINARRDLAGWKLFSTKPPCLDCAKAIIQAGIAGVCCPALDEKSSWYEENRMAMDLLNEAQIDVYFDPDWTKNLS